MLKLLCKTKYILQVASKSQKRHSDGLESGLNKWNLLDSVYTNYVAIYLVRQSSIVVKY